MRNLMVIVGLGLAIYAVVDCVQNRASVRSLPWPMWLFLVIVFPFVGPIAYLLLGKPTTPQARGPVARPAGRPSGFPEAERRRTSAPIGPDDDPEFLAGLGEEAQHEQMLKDWEAQLREREQRLDEDEPGTGEPDHEPEDADDEQRPES